MKPSDSEFDTPSIAYQRQLNSVCDRFETAWKATVQGGSRPLLHDFTSREDLDETLVRELVRLDLYYRCRSGEQPKIEEYAEFSTILDADWFTELLEEHRHSTTLGIKPRRVDSDTPLIGSQTIGFELPRDFGEYELLEEIARGGMGVVFRAQDRNLQRTIALKMILSGQFASFGEVERFHREARSAAKLEHPHIVPILEVGEYDSQYYFTMRLISGGNLNQVLNRLTPSPQEGVRLLLQIAEAVQYAHSKAILHRDLKPANILIEGDLNGPVHEWNAYVTDFGLAKQIGDHAEQTRSNAILGTPAYMAPEQAAGQIDQIGTTTDIYGLGAILYTLLAGRSPFQGSSVGEILYSVQHHEPLSIRSLNRIVPPDLQTICSKAMQKDPSKRYSSVADFAEDLRRFLMGKPIHARPVSNFERAWKWIHRHPRAATFTAFLLLILGGGFGLVLWQWQEAIVARTHADEKAKSEEKANVRAQEALSKLRIANYFHIVAQAYLELQANNIATAEQTLELCDPELRGWEWRYVKAQCHQPLWTFQLTQGNVGTIAFSPDRQHLAVASGSGSTVSTDSQHPRIESQKGIEIFDLGTGQRVRRIEGTKEVTRDLVFSPDGKILYACGELQPQSDGGVVRAWEWATGKQVWSSSGNLPTFSRMALSPNGTTLALAEGNTIQLWDPTTHQQIHTIYCQSTVHSICFDTHGFRLAAGLKNSVVVYDPIQGNLLSTYSNLPGTDFRSVDWHPSSDVLGLANSRGQGFLLRLNTGEFEIMIDQESSVNRGIGGVLFNPQGDHFVLSCADGTVRIFHMVTGPKTKILRGHTQEMRRLAMSPGGSLLACGSRDGKVQIWDSRNWKFSSKTEQSKGQIQSLVSSEDGRFAFSAGNFPRSENKMGSICIWDQTSEKAVRILDQRIGGFTSIARSREGLLAYDFDREIKLLRLVGNEWKEWLKLSGHEDRLMALSFHPQGNELASASRDGTVKIWRWSMTSGKPQPILMAILKHHGIVNSLAYSPQGNRIISGESSGTIHIWDSQTFQLLDSWKAHEKGITAFAIHPTKEELATGSSDGTIILWDIASRSPIHVLIRHAGAVSGLAYSPDGLRLVSIGAEGDLNLCHPNTGSQALTIRQQLSEPGSVVFSSDGERLLIGNGPYFKILHSNDIPKDHNQRLLDWHQVEYFEVQRSGRRPAALYHLTQVLKQKPADATWRVHRAWLFAESGNWEEAAKDSAHAAKCTDLTTSLEGVGFWQIWLRTAFGEKKEIQQMCSRILDQYEKSADPFMCYLTGVVCGFRPDCIDNPMRLVEMMKRAIEKQPKAAYHWEVLAVSQLRAGQWKEAISATTRHRELEPKSHGIDFFVEAIAYSKLDEMTKARECYDKGKNYYTTSGEYERRSRTRYFDYLSFQREAAQALNLEP